MSYVTEQRTLSRSSVGITAEIDSGTGTILSSRTKDVTLKSLYVYSETALAVGTPCEIRLWLQADEPSPGIHARGHVARVDDAGMAIEIDEIADTESFSHLQNLVLLNAADIEATERELEAYLTGRTGFA